MQYDECPFTGPAAQAAANEYAATLAPEVPAPPVVAPAAPLKPAAGTRRHGDQYAGVIRLGRTVVLDCGHTHANRDMSYPGRLSARDCATRIIIGAGRPATAEHYAEQYRTAWTRLSPAVFTASTIERAKAASTGDAAAYLAAVAAVAALSA